MRTFIIPGGNMKVENCANVCTPRRFFFTACILTIILLIILFSGCNRREKQDVAQLSDAVPGKTAGDINETTNSSKAEELQVQDLRNLQETLCPPPIKGKSISRFARILRTPPEGEKAGVSTDPLILLSSNDLAKFLEESRVGWQFSEEDERLLKTVYDEDFFQNKVLIAGALGLNSGSIQVGIEDVLQTEDHLAVLFNFTFPERGTTDMMSWHYFIEIEAGEAADREAAKSYMPNMNLPKETE